MQALSNKSILIIKYSFLFFIISLCIFFANEIMKGFDELHDDEKYYSDKTIEYVSKIDEGLSNEKKKELINLSIKKSKESIIDLIETEDQGNREQKLKDKVEESIISVISSKDYGYFSVNISNLKIDKSSKIYDNSDFNKYIETEKLMRQKVNIRSSRGAIETIYEIVKTEGLSLKISRSAMEYLLDFDRKMKELYPNYEFSFTGSLYDAIKEISGKSGISFSVNDSTVSFESHSRR